MSSPRFLAVVRRLVEAYQAFETTSGRHIRSMNLTPAQFDIVATLGNTRGMTCKALGEATLITKGTLTGVLDRLEQRGLITRLPSAVDGRSMIVALTVAGDELFQAVFPGHVDYLATGFAAWSEADILACVAQLVRLKQAFALEGQE